MNSSIYLFRGLDEIRGSTYGWMIEDSELRLHDSIIELTPAEYFSKNAGNSIFQLSIDREAYTLS